MSGKWLGCQECSSNFDCYEGKVRCIRLPITVTSALRAEILGLRQVLVETVTVLNNSEAYNNYDVIAMIEKIQKVLK